MKSYNICAFVPGLFSLSIILYILPTWKHVFCFYSFSWLSSIPLFVCPQPSLLVQSLPVGLPAGGYIVLISLRTHSVLAAFTAQAGCKLNNWRVHTALETKRAVLCLFGSALRLYASFLYGFFFFFFATFCAVLCFSWWWRECCAGAQPWCHWAQQGWDGAKRKEKHHRVLSYFALVASSVLVIQQYVLNKVSGCNYTELDWVLHAPIRHLWVQPMMQLWAWVHKCPSLPD